MTWFHAKTGSELATVELPSPPVNIGVPLRLSTDDARFRLFVGTPPLNQSGSLPDKRFPAIKLVAVDMQARKIAWETETHADWSFR